MSFRVEPSAPDGLSSSSSLVTLAITTLLVRSPSHPEAFATKSETLNVRYLWLGGHIATVLLLSVITGGPPTVRIAVCVALPQVPVVVTVIVCGPELSAAVGTLMDELSPLYGKPSKVQA